MPIHPVTDTPTRVDNSASTLIQVQNTGANTVTVFPDGAQVAPAATVTVPGWSATPVTVQCAPGRTSTVDVTLTAGSPAARPGPGPLVVDPGGRSMTVTVAGATLYTDKGLTTAATFPATVSAPTSYWPAGKASVTVTATVAGKTFGPAGVTLDGQAGARVEPGDIGGAELTDAIAAAGTGTYASRRRLLGALAEAGIRGYTPAPLDTTATVTESTSMTMTGQRNYIGTDVTWLGGLPSTNLTQPMGNLNMGVYGSDTSIGFTLVGDVVELAWRANQAGGQTFWIYVDGKPTTAAPFTTSLSVSAGSNGYLKLAFGSQGTRDIRIYGNVNWSVDFIFVDKRQTISKSPSRPWSIGCVGDSFGDTVGGALLQQCWPLVLCNMLGAERIMNAQGGTGFYVGTGAGGGSGGPFGDPRRISGMAACNPDLIVVFGGTNDRTSSPSLVQAAAAQYFADLATALPAVPVIVFGPQQQTHTADALTNYAQVAQAIRTASLAAPNVIGYRDPSGLADTGTVPAAWQAGVTYNGGDKFIYQGGVWRNRGTAHSDGSAPDVKFNENLSWLTGTGRVGSLTGDGNRDLYLTSDQVHPTPAGQQFYAARMAGEIVSILTAA